MPPVYHGGMSTRKTKGMKRYPAILMYPEDIAAKKVNESYWKPKMGRKFAYAEIMRKLQLLEAKTIKETGKSLLSE